MFANGRPSYPELAQLIFNAPDRSYSGNKNRQRLSKQDTVPGYRKAGIPVRNPKIAANIEMMHQRWLAAR